MYLNIEEFPSLEATGIIGAHITGFSGLRVFSVVQVQHFSNNWYMSTVPVLLACVAVLTRAYFGYQFRHAAIKGDGKVDEAEEDWNEQCHETENDFIGMTISFVFVNSLMFMITGELPGVETEFYDEHSTAQMTWLLACLLHWMCCCSSRLG